MPRYVAFLRGINVTGSRMSAAELCEPFTDLGFEDVTSFRASGNVIFSTGRQSPAKLEQAIEAEFRARLGLNAVTFIRSQAQMRALAAAEPFPAKTVESSTGKMQVTFLVKRPAAALLTIASTAALTRSDGTTASTLILCSSEMLARAPRYCSV